MNEQQRFIILREIDKLNIEKFELTKFIENITEQQNELLTKNTETMLRLFDINAQINQLEENLNA